MNCASCNVELVLVFDNPMRRHTDWTVQYDRALAIHFMGGYGMFDDPDSGFLRDNTRERTSILCHTCAHALLVENPWMQNIVDDKWGHMHGSTAPGNPPEGHEHLQTSFVLHPEIGEDV